MTVSSKQFLPVDYRKYPLYDKVVIPLIDYVLDSTAERFQYITDKYTNYLELPEEVSRELISELGFDYILDGLTLNSSDTRIILGYLKLFRLLKDSNAGLKLIVDLLGYQYETMEWFTDDVGVPFTRSQLMGLTPVNINSDPFTFSITVDLNLENLDLDKLIKLKKFSRHYVYSVLKLFLNISFQLCQLEITSAGFIDQTFSTQAMFAPSYFYMGGFIDQTFISTTVPPVTILNLEFGNSEYSNRRVQDQTTTNNDMLEVVYNPTATLDLEMFFDIQDVSSNNNDMVDATNSITPFIPALNLEFQTDTTDSSPNNNDMNDVP